MPNSCTLTVVHLRACYVYCVCIGGHKLEGLHKAAAQGDRAGIMQYMKVLTASIDQFYECI